MDTAYKTRTWWALRALDYANSIIDLEDNPPPCIPLCVPLKNQKEIWTEQLQECMCAVMSESGSDYLTRTYVDRQGNLLPQFIAEQL